MRRGRGSNSDVLKIGKFPGERERKAEEVPEALKRKREIGWSGEE